LGKQTTEGQNGGEAGKMRTGEIAPVIKKKSNRRWIDSGFWRRQLMAGMDG